MYEKLTIELENKVQPDYSLSFGLGDVVKESAALVMENVQEAYKASAGIVSQTYSDISRFVYKQMQTRFNVNDAQMVSGIALAQDALEGKENDGSTGLIPLFLICIVQPTIWYLAFKYGPRFNNWLNGD